jgi:hypothetical protein
MGLCEICGKKNKRERDKTCSPECYKTRHRRWVREKQRIKRADPNKWATEYASRQTPEKKAQDAEYQADYYLSKKNPDTHKSTYKFRYKCRRNPKRRGKLQHPISKHVRYKKRREKPDGKQQPNDE